MIQNKIISSDKDLFGIVFFGTVSQKPDFFSSYAVILKFLLHIFLSNFVPSVTLFICFSCILHIFYQSLFEYHKLLRIGSIIIEMYGVYLLLCKISSLIGNVFKSNRIQKYTHFARKYWFFLLSLHKLHGLICDCHLASTKFSYVLKILNAVKLGFSHFLVIWTLFLTCKLL